MFWIPFITAQITNIWGNILSAAVTIFVMTPFLYGIMRRRHGAAASFFKLLKGNHSNKWLLFPLSLAPAISSIGLVLWVLTPLFPELRGILILVSIAIMIFIAINPRNEMQSKKIEDTFLKNLNANNEKKPEESLPADRDIMKELSDILFSDETTSPSPDTENLRSLFWTELEEALSELPPEQREIFELTELDGLPMKDIAKTMDVPVKTLLSRKHDAVIHLRKRLSGLYQDIVHS
jgi:RNA polymerase sigma factor (sigma-70 family)